MFSKVKRWLLENISETQTLAKNTFWLFFGQLGSRLLRALIVIYAARVLGAASWGAFAYALGVAALLTIFSDIGINALITRQVTRNPELKTQYLSTAFVIKLGLLVLFVGAVLLLFPSISNIPEATSLMPILIFVFAFDTLRDLGSALSRALEKMQIEASIQIFTNFAIVVLGFFLLSIYRTSFALAVAYVVGSGLGLLAIFYTLRSHFKKLTSSFRPHLIKPILATAWPFGLLGIMGAINLNTDIIMLGWLRSAEEVGFYAAAQKLIQLLYVVPSLIAASTFPLLSRHTHQEPARARELLEKSLALVLAIALPMALFGIPLASTVITILFGAEYTPAISAFQILLLTLLIVYPGTLLGNAVFAYDAQKSFVTFVLIAFLSNIVFNFLFIPRWGIEGAAASTVLAQLLTNILIWRKMKALNRFRVWPVLHAYLKQ